MQVQFSNLLVLAAMVSMGCAHAAENSPLQITTKRDTDKVEVKAGNGKIVISVRSQSGIGQAVIARRVDSWPEIVMLRLHSKGLENLKIASGTDTLEAAVSSQDGKVRLWKDGKEDSPLDPKHPYWMEIRMVGRDGKPVKTIPLEEGCFEMKLPEPLFEGNPESITFNWIDFYR